VRGTRLKPRAYESYQAMGALLALNGMVAFVFDPIDQGERGQYMGKDGWPKLWGIDAHTQIGMCSPPGRSHTGPVLKSGTGMRAIDFLQSRPEVRSKNASVARAIAAAPRRPAI